MAYAQSNKVQPNKLYVGNLAYSITSEELAELFPNSVGAKVIHDRDSGRSKGFGFVEFADDDQINIDKALEMNGQDFHGRPLVVSRAKERSQGRSGFRNNGNRRGHQGGRSNFGNRDHHNNRY